MAALPQVEGDDSERRIAPRVRTLKRAKILFNNRYSTFDCVVRNISATGALLTIDAAAPLPKEFEIRIGEDQTLRLAKLVYRREMFAGIHFLDSNSQPAVAAPSTTDQAAADVETHEFDEIRIVAKPLPKGIARRLPWAA